MIKLKRQVDYALQFLVALSNLAPGQSLSLKKFSQDSSISFLFLQKIAHQLRRANLINAKSGRAGGYILSRPVGNLTLRTVIEIVDGPFGLSQCTRPGQPCDKNHQCAIKSGTERLNAALLRLFEGFTVSQLR